LTADCLNFNFGRIHTLQGILMMLYSKLLGAGALLAAVAMPTVANSADAYEPVSDVWTGAYIGAFGGYEWLDADGEFEGAPLSNDTIDGFMLGSQIGYNHQINNMVLGIEAELAYSFADGSFDAGGEGAEFDQNYLGTLRARAGMVFGEGDSTLLFATAGVALSDFDAEFEGESAGNSHLGLVVGVGVEHMITESVSIKAEYNYLDFGNEDYDDAEGEDVSYDGHVAKLGINFHF